MILVLTVRVLSGCSLAPWYFDSSNNGVVHASRPRSDHIWRFLNRKLSNPVPYTPRASTSRDHSDNTNSTSSKCNKKLPAVARKKSVDMNKQSPSTEAQTQRNEEQKLPFQNGLAISIFRSSDINVLVNELLLLLKSKFACFYYLPNDIFWSGIGNDWIRVRSFQQHHLASGTRETRRLGCTT